MNTFLRQLIESGHVSVAAYRAEDAPARTDAVGIDLFLEMDRHERLEFPGDAPALSVPAVRWAATAFHAACQLLICRDVPAAGVAEALGTACPGTRSPGTHYSVDLALRFLPDLLGLARRLAAGDALVDALVRLAAEWPLSSVGVPGLNPEDLSEIDTFVGHRGLRQLYADRIIQHDDTSRLQPRVIRAAVAASLGQYAAVLGPNLAASLGAPASLPASHDP